MKRLLSIIFMSLTILSTNAFAQGVGIIDFDKIQDNYSKAKQAVDEISDKYSELQRYTLDKEREYKKLSTPLERKSFEDSTAKELEKRQEALVKLKEKKETEINAAIKAAIKQVAIANQLDTVIDSNVVFFGGIDVTDKVIKQLNSAVAK